MDVLGDMLLIGVIFLAFMVLFIMDLNLQSHNRRLIGSIEKWNNDDSTANKTWYLLGIKIFRKEWTHSTWLDG